VCRTVGVPSIGRLNSNACPLVVHCANLQERTKQHAPVGGNWTAE
jgi:hypothetical protein